MANRAYASVWCSPQSEVMFAEVLGSLLGTVPFSAAHHGFTAMAVRAMDNANPPTLEMDFRLQPASPAEMLALVREHLQADTALELVAYWDLWVYDLPAGRWEQSPQKMEITCYGEEFDEGAFAQYGHLCAAIGFEHLFTGHAGLLASRGVAPLAPQHPVEAEFLSAMSQPERLAEYALRTRENVRKLHDWVRSMERAAPVKRHSLWSEGEENFEARLDEILTLA
jgi:hypothetical protein